ncbi:MAG: class I SAM-dependent methyltransferase [Pseudomonadales bacterium]
MRCSLCQNPNKPFPISEYDAKSNAPLKVAMCERCGLIQQYPKPEPDSLHRYYTDDYRQDYKTLDTPQNKHIQRAGYIAAERIKHLLNNRIYSGNLVDIGAGGGEFVYLSRKCGFNASGLEPNIGYSQFAIKHYDGAIATGNLNDLSGKHDVITLFHVLEHLLNPVQAFSQLASALNPGGHLFIEVPWIEAADASPKNIYFKAHIYYFSIDTLIACASQYFKVVSVDTTANLKVIFQLRDTKAPLLLPGQHSVEQLKTRLACKGWLEYLRHGGLKKPLHKIQRSITERKVRGQSPTGILNAIHQKAFQYTIVTNDPPEASGY